MAEKPKIGWVGLGKMGIPMSTNLVKAGYALTVYDVIYDKTEGMAKQGAQVADSPKALANYVDVMFSMIPDDLALKEVSIGPKGGL